MALVGAEDYAESVRRATMFLEGKSDQLGEELMQDMQAASERLEFERAARLRDLLGSLRSLQNRQFVEGRAADLDVLACATQGAHACVLLLAFRDGRNLGTRAFFPKTNGEDSADEILGAFVSQYYVEHTPPREILLDREIPEAELIEHALSASAERKVALKWNVRGERAGYVELASRNAQQHAGPGADQPERAASPKRGAAGDAGPGRTGQAGGVLRYQPHLGRGHGGFLRRVRRRRPGAGGSIGVSTLPALRPATITRRCARHWSGVFGGRWRRAACCRRYC